VVVQFSILYIAETDCRVICVSALSQTFHNVAPIFYHFIISDFWMWAVVQIIIL